jgi:uncharacterized protein YxjI
VYPAAHIMRCLMKQKLWSFADKFTINDAAGNGIFYIDGKTFSLGHKLSFQDLQGNELAYIAQKLLSFKTTYEINRDNNLLAHVVKDFTFFKDQYTVDIPGPNDYEVKGDFWDYEYAFCRSGREVAHVSKAFFAWTDTYGVDIVDGEDDITILATTVVIDLVNQDRRRR